MDSVVSCLPALETQGIGVTSVTGDPQVSGRRYHDSRGEGLTLPNEYR